MLTFSASKRIGAALLLALCWMATALPALAATNRYVATNGNNHGGGNDCTAASDPCATIQHAIDRSAVDGTFHFLCSGTSAVGRDPASRNQAPQKDPDFVVDMLATDVTHSVPGRMRRQRQHQDAARNLYPGNC